MLKKIPVLLILILLFIQSDAQTYKITEISLGGYIYYVPADGEVIITDSTFTIKEYSEKDTIVSKYKIVKKEGDRYTLKNYSVEVIITFIQSEDKAERKKGIVFMKKAVTVNGGNEMVTLYKLKKE